MNTINPDSTVATSKTITFAPDRAASVSASATAVAADLRARVEDLNALVLGGKLLEGHDRHYSDDVVQQENELEPTAGKAANREEIPIQ